MVQIILEGVYAIKFSSIKLEMSLVYGSSINALAIVLQCIFVVRARVRVRVCVLYCGFMMFFEGKPHSNELLALRFEMSLALASVNQPTRIGHVWRIIIQDSTLATSCLLKFYKYMVYEMD